MKMKAMKIVGLLLVSCMFCASGWCKPGDPNDPIKITTAKELAEIGKNKETLSKSYRLMNDIDLKGWGGDKGWTPIGTNKNPFTGTFDGGEKTISNLTINRPACNAVGLFGYTRKAEISNVYLENMNVTGKYYVGGLAGYIEETEITKCYGRKTVIRGESFVGGLIGYMSRGYICWSHASVPVSGSKEEGAFFGGLVGYIIQGDVKYSYAEGGVSGLKNKCNNIGGLVGRIEGGNVRYSYAKGGVSGYLSVGGLVGHGEFVDVTYSYATGRVSGTKKNLGGLMGYKEAGNIKNSYAIGDVYGTDNAVMVGGLVGNTSSGKIKHSYATGLVHGGKNCGGLTGCGFAGYATNSYWDTQTTGQTRSPGSDDRFGKTTTDMKKRKNYDGWDFTPKRGIWSIDEGKDSPTLQWYKEFASSYHGGLTSGGLYL